MSDIPEGHGLIAGRGREIAQAALEAAKAAGVDPIEVRTTVDGYVVPEKVLKKYEDAQKKASASADTEPVEKPAPKKPAPKKKS